jgi:transposase
VLPTRPYKPRDKAKVESGVQVVQRWIVAALRHRRFFSLAELNQAIRELLDKLNQRPFRKRPGCRASLFQELDQPALGPLPRERYEFHQWATARVNIDYHVEFERHYYSVPYVLTGQLVEIRATLTTVEIFQRGERVASHLRSRQPYQATTIPEHRPKSHPQHLAWPPSRLLSWAQSVGPPPSCSPPFWKVNRTQKWATARVWASFDWASAIRPNVWKRPPRAPSPPAPAPTEV